MPDTTQMSNSPSKFYHCRACNLDFPHDGKEYGPHPFINCPYADYDYEAHFMSCNRLEDLCFEFHYNNIPHDSDPVQFATLIDIDDDYAGV